RSPPSTTLCPSAALSRSVLLRCRLATPVLAASAPRSPSVAGTPLSVGWARHLSHSVMKKGGVIDTSSVTPPTFMSGGDLLSQGRSEEHTSELQSRENIVC